MKSFEAKIQKAVEDGVVANAVVAGYTAKDPESIYTKAFGRTSVEADAPDVQLDALFWIASCTKLLTTISALQCVERGLVTLDEPISRILPEYTSPSIITGLDPSSKIPILKPATKQLTLRHLLTHTSGMGYAMMSPLLHAWSNWENREEASSEKLKPFLLPLTFEPGEDGMWQYGLSTDWVGFVAERVNNGVRLGEYMQENIFTPLGMTSTTFHPLGSAFFKERLLPRMRRSPESGLLSLDTSTIFRPTEQEPAVDAGGSGIYSTAGDYIKVLRSLLLEDGKGAILGQTLREEMFTPQLIPHQRSHDKLANWHLPKMMGKSDRWSFSLGGVIAVEGIEGRAEKGTMWWDGVPGCFWFIDRNRGTCGFYGSQILPHDDVPTAEIFQEFQTNMYRDASSSA